MKVPSQPRIFGCGGVFTVNTRKEQNMNPEIKFLWTAALRSGDYRQGRGVLRRSITDSSVSEYCCLGVLCELAVQANIIPAAEYDWFYYRYGVQGDKHTAYLPEVVQRWAGLSEENPLCGTQTLGILNDNYIGQDAFDVIADLIEVNL